MIWRNWNPFVLPVGMSNGTTTVRNTKVLPQKVKNGITIDLAIPLLGIYPKELKAGFCKYI